MKLLYSVFDREAVAYGPIMAFAHDAVAIRGFAQALTDRESTIGKYPEAFELHCLGEFVDDGELNPNQTRVMGDDVPRVVVTASQVLASQARGPELAREA